MLICKLYILIPPTSAENSLKQPLLSTLKVTTYIYDYNNLFSVPDYPRLLQGCLPTWASLVTSTPPSCSRPTRRWSCWTRRTPSRSWPKRRNSIRTSSQEHPSSEDSSFSCKPRRNRLRFFCFHVLLCNGKKQGLNRGAPQGVEMMARSPLRKLSLASFNLNNKIL